MHKLIKLIQDINSLNANIMSKVIDHNSIKLLKIINCKIAFIKQLSEIKDCIEDLKRSGYKLKILQNLYKIAYESEDNEGLKVEDIPFTKVVSKKQSMNLRKIAIMNSALNFPMSNSNTPYVGLDAQLSFSTQNNIKLYSFDESIRCHSASLNRKKPFDKTEYEERLEFVFSKSFKQPRKIRSSCDKFCCNDVTEKYERLNKSCRMDYFLGPYNTKTKKRARCNSAMGRINTKIDSEDSSVKTTQVSINDFETIKGLSSGAYGKVCLVKKLSSGDYFAMKVIDKEITAEKSQEDYIRSEVTIMRSVDSDFIVKLYYSFQNDRYLFFVMEYMNGGDLGNILQNLGCLEEKV